MSKVDEGEVAHWRHLLASKSEYVIGCAEVGMGAWAGPVYVAATIFKSTWGDPRVKDSKRYSGVNAHEKRHNVLRDVIRPNAAHMAIACMSAEKVDKNGIDDTWMILMRSVILECLSVVPDAFVVVDGSSVRGLPGLVMALPKADNIVPAVSAASVYAKVIRDALMKRADVVYPQYGFESNVGYGTLVHETAINNTGLCPLHRRSYGPIKNYLSHGRTRRLT